MICIIWNEWQKNFKTQKLICFDLNFPILRTCPVVFTENRSNVKNFSSQTCCVLKLANLAILRQKWGARDAAVVRSLASHQSGLGSANPGVDSIHVCRVCCWFSHLLREVFLLVLHFFPLLKNQHFQIPIRPGIRYKTNHFVGVLPLNRWLFYLFFYLKWSISSRSKVPVLSQVI